MAIAVRYTTSDKKTFNTAEEAEAHEANIPALAAAKAKKAAAKEAAAKAKAENEAFSKEFDAAIEAFLDEAGYPTHGETGKLNPARTIAKKAVQGFIKYEAAVSFE